MDRARKFRGALATWMGCDASIVDRAGVTVAGHPKRAETQMAVGYQLGEHFVITCDPAVESMLANSLDGMAPSLESWKQFALANSGELLGAGRMQLLANLAMTRPELPAGFDYRTLRSDDDEAIELIGALIEASSAEDLDEAELAIDNLDETMNVVIAPSGEVAAYGSARPFDMAEGHGDIGVITHAGYRTQGLGVAVVRAVCSRLLDEGIEPLYRCDEENAGSMRLSASMGFEPATRLVAYRFAN